MRAFSSTRQDWVAAAVLVVAVATCFVLPAAALGDNAARGFATMTVAALVALAVGRHPFTFAPFVRSAFVCFVALALWYVLTRAWAVDPGGSMMESARVSSLVLLAWAAHTCVHGSGPRRLLLAAVAAAAVSVAAPDVWHFVRDGAPTTRIPGRLDYWNASGIAALVLVPVATAIAGSGRRWLIVVASCLIPIAGITTVATASRGALVALIVALVVQAALEPDYRGGLPRALVALASLAATVGGLASDSVPAWGVVIGAMVVAGVGFAFIGARRTRRQGVVMRAAVFDGVRDVRNAQASDDDDAAAPRRLLGRHTPPRWARGFGAVLVALMLVILVVMVARSRHDSAPAATSAGRAAQTVHTNDSVRRLATTGDSRRFAWWREGLRVWQGNPLFGRGGHAFGALHVDRPGDTADHVHSLPLEVLIETGIVGAVLLGAGFVFLLRVLRRGPRSVNRALGGGIATLLLTQALIDWTLSLPQILALLAVAGPVALPEPPMREQDVPTRHAWTAPVMLVALSIATSVALIPIVASLLASQSAAALDAGHPRTAITRARQSMVLVPVEDTLSLETLGYQATGNQQGAEKAMRINERVWRHSLSGLQLAQYVFSAGGDSAWTSKVERWLAKMETTRSQPVTD